MPRSSRSIITRNRSILVLLIVSLILLTLGRPPFSGFLQSLTQVLAPAQAAVSAVQGALASIWPFGNGSDRDDSRDESRQQAALEHQLAALTLRIQALEEENALLTRLRLWDTGAGGLGVKGMLIPARVLADDLLAWRSSKLIDAGTLRGLRSGSPVASQFFTIGQGTEDGVRDGLAVLRSEVLVGFIEQASSHTARVRLVSDVGTQMRVALGRFAEQRFDVLEERFWIKGAGAGKMEIGDVDRRLVEQSRVRVGDLVLCDATAPELPLGMVIGKVTQIAPDRANPLLSSLIVESPISLTSLDRVFVLELGSKRQ